MATTKLDDRSREALLTHARARVSWGHEPEAIRWTLLREGLTRDEAHAAIDSALAKRDRHFRWRGLGDLVVAAACLAVSAWLCGHMARSDGMRLRRPPVGAAALAGVYGVYRLYRGTTRMAFGGMGEEAEAD